MELVSKFSTRLLMAAGLATGVAMLPACDSGNTAAPTNAEEPSKAPATKVNADAPEKGVKGLADIKWAPAGPQKVEFAKTSGEVRTYESKLVIGPMTVTQYLKTNFGVSSGWGRLVDIDTGERVVDTTKDLKIGHSYILTESSVESKSISREIRAKNKVNKIKDKSVKAKKTSYQSSGSTVGTMGVQKTVAAFNVEKDDLAIVQGPAIEQIAQVTFPDGTDREITEAAKNTPYHWITPTEVALSTSNVETSLGNPTINLIEKARNAKSEKERKKFIKAARRSQIGAAGEVWGGQIKNAHLRTYLKFLEKRWEVVQGPIVWDIPVLRKAVENKIEEGIQLWKTTNEIFESFEELDIRFRAEFYSRATTDNFIKIYKELGRYNLNPTTRFELSWDGWNKGEGGAKSVAAYMKENGVSLESALAAKGYTLDYIKKHRKTVATLAVSNVRSVREAQTFTLPNLISSAEASEMPKTLKKDTPETILADVKKIKGTKKAKKVLAYVDSVEKKLKKNSLAVNDNGSKIQEEMSIERMKEDVARTQAGIKAKFGVVMTPAEELRNNITYLSKKAQEGSAEAKKALAVAEKMLIESEKARKLLNPQNDITIEQIESEISKVVAYLPQFAWREDVESKARALELKKNVEMLHNKKMELLTLQRKAA